MPEMLELLESIKAEEADVQRLFGADANEGEHRVGRPSFRNPGQRAKYQRSLMEAVTFIEEVMSGKRPAYHLQEAMSTSDFPALFGDVIDRTVLGAYQTAEANWRNIAASRDVRDFRPARIYDPRIIGGTARLDVVEELEEYPEAKLDEQSYVSLTVKKYGRKMGFSWETIINDDIDQLNDIPERFGRAARNTENRFASELYVGLTGPHTSLYTVGNKNIINPTNGATATNPPLSIAGLQDGLTVLGNQRDPDTGDPIVMNDVRLVVPPALEVLANNILNATLIRSTLVQDAGGATGREVEIANWLTRRVRIVVDPLIPVIATTSGGNTSWFLHAAPQGNRAAITLAFLRGRNAPEVWEKLPNARRVGGGALGPEDGDFETDSRMYRVRHVLGGMRLDARLTVASNGSGV